MEQSITGKSQLSFKSVKMWAGTHISKHLSCSSHVFTKKRKPISEFSQINPAKSRQGPGLGALGALRPLAALHSSNLADINVKEIQIILRLFLVITMYCQASSSQFFFNHSTSDVASWLERKPRYMQ